MKRLLALILSCALGAAHADPAPKSGFRDLTPMQLAAEMGTGWNLGNSLESMSKGGDRAANVETAWGNPAVTQQLLDAVKAAGFKTVRIPVAWKAHADAEDIVDPAWMDRVAEVVGYARKAGLYVILNTHWDGGWLQPTPAHQHEASTRLARLWLQIAGRFADTDEHVVFAGTNEVMVEGDWGKPKPEYAAVQNGFNQVFVRAVRSTGGNNLKRVLIVQGFNTNIDHTLEFFVMPKDPTPDRLMVEVHYYDPYNFTIDEKSKTWQWGSGATSKGLTAGWGDEAHVDAQFQKMKARFVDQGVPVVLGEFGVIRRGEYAESERYRQAWNGYIARSARAHGIVPVYWDNGYSSADHSMGLFDRKTGAQVFPELIKAIVNP